MKILNALTIRNVKEILRDPLSLVFCLGFPIAMLIFMQLIFSNISGGPDIFTITNYAPGIAVFGFTFTMLYVSLLVASDRTGSFFNRILVAPISPFVFLLSYILATLPIIFAQSIIFFGISLFFGLPLSLNLLVGLIYLIPSGILMIAFGLLFGILCKSEKQAGPISSIIICATGLLGGIWMPIQTISGGFETFCNMLPFIHSVDIASGALIGNFESIYPHILWVLGYTILILAITIFVYKKKIKQ